MAPDALRTADRRRRGAGDSKRCRRARWRTVLPPCAAEEGARIEGVVADGSRDSSARDRPSPSIGVEKGLALDAPRARSRLRLDRIDTLDDGGAAIIDYKTGRTVGPDVVVRTAAARAAARPLRARATGSDAGRTRARGRLRAARSRASSAVRGLAADDAAWPGLPLPPNVEARGARRLARPRSRIGRTPSTRSATRSSRGLADGDAARPERDLHALRPPVVLPDRRRRAATRPSRKTSDD